MIRTVKDYEKLSEQYNKMLEERNSLIDDLSWYKAKVSRLERENGQLSELNKQLTFEIRNYEQENDALRLQSNTYFEQWQEVKKELQDYQDDYEMVTGNCIYWEDKAHWLEDESSKYINLLSEFSQHIGNKPSSSMYKYFRRKLNALEIREGE